MLGGVKKIPEKKIEYFREIVAVHDWGVEGCVVQTTKLKIFSFGKFPFRIKEI